MPQMNSKSILATSHCPAHPGLSFPYFRGRLKPLNERQESIKENPY